MSRTALGERKAGDVTRRSAGHRILPHTADLIIEAWAPTRIGCLEEAARALVDSFARIPGDAAGQPYPITFAQDADDAILVALLEEVIFALDVLGSVPINVALSEGEDGGVAGFLEIARVDTLEIHGSAPKGASLEELFFGQDDSGWRCRATIDV